MNWHGISISLFFFINYACCFQFSPLKAVSNVDYQRYSRQMLVYGEKSQDILYNSSVLVIGSSVLSIEIIKNLALSGVGALIFMNSSASIFPISLLRRYIKSLNQDAQVSSISNLREISTTNATVVVSVDLPPKLVHEVDEYCHQRGIPSITCGLDGYDGFVSCHLRNDIEKMEKSLTKISSLYQFFKTFITRATKNEKNPHLVSPVACSRVGSVAASEILKVILSNGKQKEGSLLAFHTYQFPKIMKNSLVKPIKWSKSSPSRSYSLLSFHPASPSQVYFPTINPIPGCISSQLHNMTILLVGSGAIGCEILKILSQIMPPVPAASSRGKIIVVDPDFIEKSNLNRQVLFRDADIGKNKAVQACRNLLRYFNPHLPLAAIPVSMEAKTQQEYFNETFWDNIDVVLTALDSVEARRYVDSQCLKYGKPMIDSGTMGLNGHVQVVLPYVTESYSSSSDPSPGLIPICSIRSTPTKPEHFVAWAKEIFDENFYHNPLRAQQLVSSASASAPHSGLDTSQQRLLQEYRSIRTVEDARKWASSLFEKYFGIEEGGGKRFDKELIELFLASAAQIMLEISSSLRSPSSPTNSSIKPFDKDDISPLGHVDFLASAANLRCQLFNFTTLSSLQVRQLAGNIIPALPTSTTLAASLAVEELVKIVEDRFLTHHRPKFPGFGKWFRRSSTPQAEQTQGSLEKYRNSFFTLSEPSLISVQPQPAFGLETRNHQPVTLWDYFTIVDHEGRPLTSQTITLHDINDLLTHYFNATLSSLTWNDRLVLYDQRLSSLWFPHLSPESIPRLTIQQCLDAAVHRQPMDDLNTSPSLKGEKSVDLVMEASDPSSPINIPAPIRVPFNN